MNSVKNHWGGEVVHGTPRPSEGSIEVKDRNSLKDGETFTHEGKEWVQVRELTREEVLTILKDRRPSCLSPVAR